MTRSSTREPSGSNAFLRSAGQILPIVSFVSNRDGDDDGDDDGNDDVYGDGDY